MANKKNEQEEVQVSKSEAFFEKNKKWIFGGIGAVVVVVATILGVKWCNNSKNQEAQNSTEMTNVDAAASIISNMNPDSAAVQNLIDKSNAFVDEYGSTKAGARVKYLSALAEKELGNYDKAIEALKDCDFDDSYVQSAALCALGDCQVEKKDYKSAVENFEKAAKLADNAGMSPIFLMKAGLAYEALSDKASALKVYQQAKDSYPNSEFGQVVDKYIARVK